MAIRTQVRAQDRSITWRLGVRTHKAVLLLHILSAGAWFGLDVAMAALVFTAVTADDPARRRTAIVRSRCSPSGRCSQRASSAS